MNLQAYITSGILELYVNGLVTPEEIREVEEMAAQHPEVQQEIDAIRQAIATYVGAHAVEPPAGLKDKVLQRLDQAPKGRPSKSKPNHENHERPVYREPKAATETNLSSVVVWILGVALLGMGVAVFLFWQDASRANARVKSAEAQVEQVKKDCETEKARANELKEQFVAIRHWATKPVQMKGTDLGGDAFAVVYWNNIKKTSFLDVVKLPQPPSDKQYQLWAIVAGQPTDMGVFELETENGALQKVEFIETPQAFAVTLEPKGGSETPTLDQMYVVGAVGKG